MFDAARLRLALACIGALALPGCMTPRIDPQVSQAVIDARAHRNVPAAATCPQAPLNTVSPVMIGFGFNETDMTTSMTLPLALPAQWLACHPGTQAVIVPDADTHGTDAEQDALARQRAEHVRNYLTANGVAAQQIRILRRGETPPTGDLFFIRAEGRRW
jgi:outer membrane protein OmpA-like peptidoglycan-associated protein